MAVAKESLTNLSCPIICRVNISLRLTKFKTGLPDFHDTMQYKVGGTLPDGLKIYQMAITNTK
jgi:hypothetical protein